MQNINDLFQDELNNPETGYFIFDTKSDSTVGDIDFEEYSWNLNRYGLVNEGDLLIYRRPANSSPTSRFFFFGVCKINEISEPVGENKRVTALLSKGLPFKRYVDQADVEGFTWRWKARDRQVGPKTQR